MPPEANMPEHVPFLCRIRHQWRPDFMRLSVRGNQVVEVWKTEYCSRCGRGRGIRSPLKPEARWYVRQE
jgi:hypothetical protein